MSRTVLPSEDCVFRLDSEFGYKQQFPCTFNDVGLGADGFEFNGSSSYISCGERNIFNVGTSLTLEATIEYKSDPSTFNGKVIHGSSSYFLYNRISDSSLQIGIISSSNSAKIPHSMLEVNKIYHIIGTYDSTESSDQIKIYMDGNLVSTGTYSNPIAEISSDVRVGGDIGGLYFNGIISCANVYNRALKSTEVKQRYREQTFRLE